MFDPALKLNERIKAEAIARGVATYPMGGTIDGKQGDHVIVAPPYIVNEADIDAIVERLGDAVDAAFLADTPSFKSVMISTLGYGDPATIFERSPRPEFDKFNRIV